jgi:MATE family multidrug resistance protein
MSINVQRGAAKRENRTPLLEGTADDSVEAEAETVVETGQSGFTIRGEARVMWAMGWPLVVGFMCRFAMATTDSAFLGHLTNSTNGTFLDGKVYTGEQYLAASALSDMVCNILLGPPLAFNQVLNSLVGQALGSGNPKMAGNWLQNSVLWLSLTTVPSIIIMYTQVAPILKLLGFSPEIAHLSGLYAQWNVFWPIPNGIYQCMRFYFQAQGMSRPAMYASRSELTESLGEVHL